MSSVARVGEIFSAAGTAFTRLAEITSLLNVNDLNTTGSGPPLTSDTMNGSQKWEEEDIEMLHGCIKKFGDDLNILTERIKVKSLNQMKQGIKRKMTGDMINNTGAGDGPVASTSSSSPVKKVIITPVSTPIVSNVQTVISTVTTTTATGIPSQTLLQ